MSHPPESSTAGENVSAAEADFTRLFNLSLDLLCIAGLDGYFRRVNPSWTRVLGWTEQELLSRPVEEFMHPEDRERTLAARAGLAQGTPVRGLENRYRCKDGTYRWLAWQSVSIPETGTVIAVARDVTERRQLDHERLIVSKLESMGVMAGGIAHDFNNLLTGLGLNLEMLAISGELTREQHSHLGHARESLVAAKALTDRLIAVVRGSTGSRERCNLRPLLEDALVVALTGSALKAETKLSADLWLVEANRAQLAEVFRGLLHNARDAKPANGLVRVTAENVTTESRAPKDDRAWVVIRIEDRGVGIPPDVLPKIYDPYFSTKQRGSQKGMGLGLTMCRVAIQDHGGTIEIASKPQQGTTVTVRLPAVRASG